MSGCVWKENTKQKQGRPHQREEIETEKQSVNTRQCARSVMKILMRVSFMAINHGGWVTLLPSAILEWISVQHNLVEKVDPNICLQHFYSEVKHSMQSDVVLLVLLISLFVARSSPLFQLFVASFQSFTSLSVALFVASCPPFTFPRPIVCCQELERPYCIRPMQLVGYIQLLKPSPPLIIVNHSKSL